MSVASARPHRQPNASPPNSNQGLRPHRASDASPLRETRRRGPRPAHPRRLRAQRTRRALSANLHMRRIPRSSRRLFAGHALPSAVREVVGANAASLAPSTVEGPSAAERTIGPRSPHLRRRLTPRVVHRGVHLGTARRDERKGRRVIGMNRRRDGAREGEETPPIPDLRTRGGTSSVCPSDDVRGIGATTSAAQPAARFAARRPR